MMGKMGEKGMKKGGCAYVGVWRLTGGWERHAEENLKVSGQGDGERRSPIWRAQDWSWPPRRMTTTV